MRGWSRGSLNYRPVTLMMVVALVAVTAFMFFKTSGELAPEEDAGALFSLVTAPRYATSAYTEPLCQPDDGGNQGHPRAARQFLGGGVRRRHQFGAFAVWAFKDWAERTRKQAALQQDIQGRISKVAGVQALVFAPPSLPGAGGGLPISMIIQSTGDASQVYEVAEEIKNKAQASGRFIIVQNSLAFDAPQVTVTIDRDRAAALNLSVADIGRDADACWSAAARCRAIRSRFQQLRHHPASTAANIRNNPQALGQFFVRSVTDQMVPLSAVVNISTNASPAAIEQFNQLNAATISALPLPGVTTGDGLATIENIARPLLPTGFFIDYSGQSRLEKQQGNTILIAFGLAVVVIYLVLAAQFESFRDPLIIMMSVPLSIFGAIVPLNLGLGTLNIYTQVGLITLIGLITKHGILLVEFANQQREQHGMRRRDAIIASAKVRLRPILMTTAAMALGVVPLIIAQGAGAAARYSMGLVIFSGILVGTMFTLFVVPMFYTYIASKDLPQHAEKPDPSLMPALAD